MKNPNPQSNSTGKFQIKKEITDFLKDEKGFVSKATMLKVGLTTLSGLTLLSGMEAHAGASHTSSTYPSINTYDGGGYQLPDGSTAGAQHQNVCTQHRSHTSY